MSKFDPPAIQEVKARAKEMMQFLKAQGQTDVKHGHCLDALAVQAGYKDWNTYSAALRKEAGLTTSKSKEIEDRKARHAAEWAEVER